MCKKDAFRNFIKRPHGVVLAIVYILTVIAVAAAVTLTIAWKDGTVYEVLSYAVYAVAALFLGYSVYTFVIYVPKIKSAVLDLLRRHAFTSNLVDNYQFKTVVFSLVSFVMTCAFAIMNLVSAIRYELIWYYAISAYYFVLLVLRGGISYAELRSKKELEGIALEKRRLTIYLSGGIVLLLLEIAMAAAVTEMMLSRRPLQTGMIYTIANAAYTFYKMGMAIYNLVRASRLRDPVVQSLRNINFADACMSIVSLTVLMLATFGTDNAMIATRACVGFSACVAIIVLAVVMIVRGTKGLKKLKGSNNG